MAGISLQGQLSQLKKELAAHHMKRFHDPSEPSALLTK